MPKSINIFRNHQEKSKNLTNINNLALFCDIHYFARNAKEKQPKGLLLKDYQF